MQEANVAAGKEISTKASVKDASAVLAFDIGGSHAAAVVYRSLHDVSAPSDVKMDNGADAETLFKAMEQAGREALSKSGTSASAIAGLSFAFPGPFDYEQGISLLKHKFQALYELNVRAEMAKRFGLPGETVVFLNDAQAYLLGELQGLPKGRTVGITLGTGIGSAFAVDGHIVTGGKGVPSGGEIYNIPWQGGIVEDEISTIGILALHRQMGGRRETVHDIALHASDEEVSARTMREFGKRLGTVLNAITSTFAPDTIIVGGAVARSAELFLPYAQKQMTTLRAEFRVSQLFEQAALQGAGVYWKQRLATK